MENDGRWARAVRALRLRRGARRRTKVILALQGGGSYGAFTWGVLDSLLADERLLIEGISGTSAGAVNAVTLASGLAEGGREGARAALARVWHAVARAGTLSPLNLPGAEVPLRVLMHCLSPYQLNPLNLNPLRQVLESTIDFARLRRERPVKLFLAATSVRTGMSRIIREDEVTIEAVLASACLPTISQAVTVEGEQYWDGGYSSNPPLLAPVAACRARELVLVRLNRSSHDTTPTTARQIETRAALMVFQAPLLRELETMAALRHIGPPARWLARGLVRKVRRLRLHDIGVDQLDHRLTQTGALNASPSFVEALHDAGAAAGADWLESRFGRRPERARLAA